MARIHLVRHGRAAAGWDRDPDPALDVVGAAQAVSVAERLVSRGPLTVVTSPLRRCRQTAAPLARRWGVSPIVEAAVAEVLSPVGVAMEDRMTWLRHAAAGAWRDLDDRYAAFRDGVVRYVAGREHDAVVFSHFIAINAVIGACLGDDRVVIRRLDNASVTIVDTDAGTLRLVEAGHEADTLIR